MTINVNLRPPKAVDFVVHVNVVIVVVVVLLVVTGYIVFNCGQYMRRSLRKTKL